MLFKHFQLRKRLLKANRNVLACVLTTQSLCCLVADSLRSSAETCSLASLDAESDLVCRFVREDRYASYAVQEWVSSHRHFRSGFPFGMTAS